MKGLAFSMSLAVVSNVFYHVSQKIISDKINPLVSLIVTYIIAIIGCLILIPFFPSQTRIMENFKYLNAGNILLGFSIIGLEAGFLLIYRSGWNMNTAVIFANVAVALLLIPIGLIFFQEKISTLNIIGIFFCLVGLVFLNLK
ncbi:MAG: EamA family transporter [Fusobacteriaceae bacterium]